MHIKIKKLLAGSMLAASLFTANPTYSMQNNAAQAITIVQIYPDMLRSALGALLILADVQMHPDTTRFLWLGSLLGLFIHPAHLRRRAVENLTFYLGSSAINGVLNHTQRFPALVQIFGTSNPLE